MAMLPYPTNDALRKFFRSLGMPTEFLESPPARRQCRPLKPFIPVANDEPISLDDWKSRAESVELHPDPSSSQHIREYREYTVTRIRCYKPLSSAPSANDGFLLATLTNWDIFNPCNNPIVLRIERSLGPFESQKSPLSPWRLRSLTSLEIIGLLRDSIKPETPGTTKAPSEDPSANSTSATPFTDNIQHILPPFQVLGKATVQLQKDPVNPATHLRTSSLSLVPRGCYFGGGMDLIVHFAILAGTVHNEEPCYHLSRPQSDWLISAISYIAAREAGFIPTLPGQPSLNNDTNKKFKHYYRETWNGLDWYSFYLRHPPSPNKPFSVFDNVWGKYLDNLCI